MRETSATYKTLRQQPDAWYDVRVTQGENVYTDEVLRSVKVYQALFEGSGPEIGQTNSAQCEITLIESSDNWPRMAAFSLDVRLTNGTTTSEWLSIGTYYTDERSEDKYGNLSIVGYDGMLLLERPWTDAIEPADLPASWPITAKAWTDLVEDANLIELESGTTIDDTVELIGLNTASTVRDVRKTIAAEHGGNWEIDPDGKLKLVLFNSADIGTSSIAGIAITGIAVVGTSGIGNLTPDDLLYLGLNIMDLKTSPDLEAVSGVTLETAGGSKSVAGDDTGYMLLGSCDFSDSEGVAGVALANAEGYVYRPFEATTAILDPAAELGDLVIIDGKIYQIMTIDWNFARMVTANISARYDEEVDHEYQIVSESAKTLRKALEADKEVEARVYSSIEQTAESIMTQVGEEFETTLDANTKFVTLQTTITQTKDAVELEIQTVDDNLDELKMHYRFDENGETIGKSNSERQVRLANDGIDMMINDEAVSHWDQDKLEAPVSVVIPIEGNLQQDNFLWQPRSSGHLSLLWVGD